MKYVLITGASGGMGLAMVEFLKQQDYFIFALDKILIEKEANVMPIYVDVTKYETIDESLKLIKEKTNHLDYILHFVGIYQMDSLVEIETDEWEKIFQINLFGHFYLNKTFLPLCEKTRIITITSELAPLNPLPFTGLYAITKAALEKYCYSLRMELQLLNIDVTVVRAGAVKTPMLDVSTSSLDRFCQKTKLYPVNAQKFKKIVDRVENKNILPIVLAKKVYKIMNKKKTKFAYAINANFYLKLLHKMPQKFQFWIIRKLLKEK